MNRRPPAPRAPLADSAREANLVKLRAMKPAAPLTEWYALLDEQSGVRQEALQALRRVPRRQADIQDMLAYGIPMAMILVPRSRFEARSGTVRGRPRIPAQACRGDPHRAAARSRSLHRGRLCRRIAARRPLVPGQRLRLHRRHPRTGVGRGNPSGFADSPKDACVACRTRHR